MEKIILNYQIIYFQFPICNKYDFYYINSQLVIIYIYIYKFRLFLSEVSHLFTV